MQWFWYILSANLAITVATITAVWGKPKFVNRTLARRIGAICLLLAIGVILLVMTLPYFLPRSKSDEA